ncbi:MAG: VOC family protein, partial [Lentisphaeria bacterium]|nr:VOC family protein [Lentisphaeria bacterium]
MHKDWDIVATHWLPAGVTSTLQALSDDIRGYLSNNAVEPGDLSHFGIVVENIDGSVERLNRDLDTAWTPTTRDWVAAMGVHVARGNFHGIELEFIQPVGPSFFLEALQAGGEAVHHDSGLLGRPVAGRRYVAFRTEQHALIRP